MAIPLRRAARSRLLTRRRIAILVCLAAIAAVTFAGLRLVQTSGSGSTLSPRRVGARSGEARRRPAIAESRLAAALHRGVLGAAGLGGSVEAAAMTDGSPAPIVATSEPGGEVHYMRMWSMSKVATMIALLRSLHWGDRPGDPLPAEVDSALRGAISRSENCRQRRVVLELQRLSGGFAATRQAMAAVFAGAGGQARIGTQVEGPESLCLPYLRGQTEIADPLAPTLLLGTSTWRVTDAVRLVHALAVDTYGEAVSGRVLGLMRAPKQPSRESLPGELTAPLDWGAGAAFAGLDPAYKAGWGGSQNGDFLAGQVAVVPLGAGDDLAIAVMFHPNSEPSRDDPGITAAPAALETVMDSVRSSIRPSRTPARTRSASATSAGTP